MNTEASSLTLVFGRAEREPDLRDLLADDVFRVSRYRATSQAAIGSAPLAAPDLLVLESLGSSPPKAAGTLLADGVLVAARPAIPATPVPPTSEAHAGLLVVIVGNTAEGKDPDFCRWYDETHIPEILATGAYRAAARLALDGEAVDLTGAATLALYATDWTDPDSALSELFANNPKMTLWPDNDARHVGSYAFLGRAER